MIKKIDSLIASAMKERRKGELEVYKLIKAELVKAEKDGIDLNDIETTKILLKMVAQRDDAYNQYIAGNRQDLADKEKFENTIIKQLLPEQPTDDEIADYTRTCITAYTDSLCAPLSMKDMKLLLAMVQEKYPSANGKIVSQVLQSGSSNPHSPQVSSSGNVPQQEKPYRLRAKQHLHLSNPPASLQGRADLPIKLQHLFPGTEKVFFYLFGRGELKS